MSPAVVTVPRDGAQLFSAIVTNAADTSVTWSVLEPEGGSIDQSGYYRPSWLTGTFHVVATSNEDPSATGEAVVTIGLPSISGTISYNGTQAGRIFVVAESPRGSGDRPGTTLSGPGSYTIRGVDMRGDVRLTAWMETGGTIHRNDAADPSGTRNLQLDVVDVTDADILLVDPAPQTPQAARFEGMIGGDGLLLVLVEAPRDAQGNMSADRILIEASATSDFATIARSVSIPATSHFAVLDLANGAYFVRLTPFSRAAAGPTTTTPEAINVGIPPGGHTISGVVDLTGIDASGGGVMIGAIGSGTASVAGVTSPQGQQAYVISGVPDGVYQLFAGLDLDGDSILEIGEPMSVGAGLPVLTVAGTDVTAPALRMINARSIMAVRSHHEIRDDTSEVYAVSVEVISNLARTVGAVLHSGPGVGVIRDVGLSRNDFGSPTFSMGIDRGPAIPTTTGVYTMEALYEADSELLTGAVSRVLDPPALSVDVDADPATFTWSPPTTTLGDEIYDLRVQDPTATQDLWRIERVDPAMTTIVFNFDGGASANLEPGRRYHVSMNVSDSAGNRARMERSFNMPVTVTLTPESATVGLGGTQAFFASVSGGGLVDFEVEETGGGTIDPGGLYTAPATAGTYHVIARARVDNTRFARATVTVSSSPQPDVTLSPLRVSLGTEQQQQFDATVTGGTGGPVTFDVVESGGGTIDSDGLYLAPDVSGVYHVSASADGRIAYATVEVLVQPPVFVLVEPQGRTLAPGETLQFTARVTSSSNQAVTWSVSGCSGATITTGGLLTAPSTAGTPCTLEAHSVASPAASGSATVDISDVVTVSIVPELTTLIVGESILFRSTVTGTTDRSVNFTATDAGGGSVEQTGLYTAPAIPGTYHVRVQSNADTGATADATITVVPNQNVDRISGTVTYSGTRTGRIYISATHDQNLGWFFATTSIAAPGPFTLHGDWGGGDIFVVAWMDTLGTVRPNRAADPMNRVTVTLDFDGSASGVAIALDDPPPVSPPPVDNVWISSTGDAALIRWSMQYDPQGELAERYNVYVRTSPGAGPGNAIMRRSVVAGSSRAVFVTPLVEDTQYFVAVTAVTQGVEGEPRETWFIARAQSGTGSITATGNVNLPSVAPPGSLYVLINGREAGERLLRIPTPAASGGNFVASNLNPGNYQITAVLDAFDDGYLDGDPQGTLYSGVRVELASDTTFPNFSVRNDSYALARTRHSADAAPAQGPPYDGYSISVELPVVGRRPVKVQMLSGLNAVVPVDLAISADGWRFSDGLTTWRGGTPMRAEAPTIGDRYTLNVTYDDDSVLTVDAVVNGNIALPTSLSPSGSPSGTLVPLFSWAAPSPAPQAFEYGLRLGEQNGPWFWEAWELPASTTSVLFNENQRSPVSPLVADRAYQWILEVYDQDGNTASVMTHFIAAP